MAETQTPAALQAALAKAKADPRVAAAAKAWTDFHAAHGVWNPGHGTLGPQTDFLNAIKPYLPDGYYATMGQNGEPVLQKKGMPSWVFPLALAAIGLTAGAATGAFAAAPAAASAAPAAAVPAEVGAGATIPTIAGTTYGTGMAATAPSIAGATVGAGDAAAAAAGGSQWVKKAIQVASKAAPSIGALAGGAGSQKDTSPEAQALLDQQRARMEQANPLYESVMRLALNRLPTNASQGLTVPTYDQANASVPQVDSGSYAEDPATRNLLRTQLVRGKMADPVLQAVLRLSQARMPGGR